MKYFIIITFTIVLIQLENCRIFQRGIVEANDYNDDAKSFGPGPIEEYKDEESEDKPIYDLKDAANLFKKFVKDYDKSYEDEADRESHFKNFVKNLKEINRINSDKEYSSTVDINLFSDFSAAERQSLYGVATY